MPQAQQKLDLSVFHQDVRDNGIPGYEVHTDPDKEDRPYQMIPMAEFIKLVENGDIANGDGYWDFVSKDVTDDQGNEIPYHEPFPATDLLQEEHLDLFDERRLSEDNLGDGTLEEKREFQRDCRARFFFGEYTVNEIVRVYPSFMLKAILGID